MAQEARELTSSCVITSPNKKTDSVHDGEYTSFWRSRTGENDELESFYVPNMDFEKWQTMLDKTLESLKT